MSQEILQGVPKEWLNLIDISKLQAIEKEVEENTPADKLCPPKDKWLEWARLTALDDVQVIIIGQDPYHDKGTAHGLAFSSKGRKIPPSLKNVYQCMLTRGIIKEMPKHSDLTSWAEQGVLLINLAFTTEQGKPLQHLGIWAPLTRHIIKGLCSYGTDAGKTYKFMLWGNKAKELKKYIDGDHEVLEWIHPSPLAQRVVAERRFIACDHFDKCPEINWGSICSATSVAIPEPEEKSDNASSTKISNSKRWVQVFVDGSCTGNGKAKARGGYAYAFVAGGFECKNATALKDGITPTNIRAEGMAIIKVLEVLGEFIDDWDKCEIFSDSEFWINMIYKYMPKWNAATFTAKANTDITTEVWQRWNDLISTPGKTITLVHVYAHNKAGWRDSTDPFKRWCYENNDLVDKMASSCYS